MAYEAAEEAEGGCLGMAAVAIVGERSTIMRPRPGAPRAGPPGGCRDARGKGAGGTTSDETPAARIVAANRGRWGGKAAAAAEDEDEDDDDDEGAAEAGPAAPGYSCWWKSEACIWV